MSNARRVAMMLWSGALVACNGEGDGGNGPGPQPGDDLAVEVVVDGLTNPVYLTAPEGDSRLYIVEQPGRIHVVQAGQLVSQPFLDITSRVSFGGERGLFSVAFHPDYAANGFLYVNYTNSSGDTRVERYSRMAGDPLRADPNSAKLILGVDQPFANHNGGHVTFGPDGMLYIAMGDGGSGGDPMGHGQNLATLLGALLRIDVDGGDPYAIPPDNPFVGDPGVREEIWALGLRNPWRIAFDQSASTLYVADVGQNTREEVNAVPASSGARNYGWNIMEGDRCFQPASGCDQTGLTLPVLAYANPDVGCTVIGGYAYRGTTIAGVEGHYFYSDLCGGWLRSFRLEGGAVTDHRDWQVGDLGSVLSFGQDDSGELYVLSGNGNVYRVVPR